MKKRLSLLATASLALMAQTAPAPAAPDVEMWRLDCGTVQVNVLNAFSDTSSYTGQSKTLVVSCYLIRHGTDYLLWDTGLPVQLLGAPVNKADAMSATLSVSIIDQLAKIGVKPDQVTRVGISHYHFDHIGQAGAFPAATLLIGKGDLDALRAGEPGTDARPLANWITGTGKAEGIVGDKDIFADGSVTMIDLPGHTPGHHGLLVRLKGKGAVLLSGDVAHFNENLAMSGVPGFNVNRADSLAAMDRYRKLADALKATVIIQHEPADVAKLPIFPASAR